ncbi:MAG: YiiX/YebB-like N1pC/P60 family cysteine hydrolase [Thermoanaerobaculia bacterium]
MKAGLISRWALRALTRPLASASRPRRPWNAETLASVMQPGDVLLVEGDQRLSQVISYLTTSPWSHAALYLGPCAPPLCQEAAVARFGDDAAHLIVEALAEEGVAVTPLSKYRLQRVRVCRPRNLTPEDARRVVEDAASQIGKTYDVDNIIDLARYFLPASFVPARFRRDALHFGAGKPTEVICSSLIGAAFERVGYPVRSLDARVERRSMGSRIARELLGKSAKNFRFKRTPTTLIVPRDFDLSPYFDIVKPPTRESMHYRDLPWETKA